MQHLQELKDFSPHQFNKKGKHCDLQNLVLLTNLGTINVTQGLLVIGDKHIVWQRWDWMSQIKSWLADSRAPRELRHQLPAVLIITEKLD